jgi:hypothetical protein
MMAREGQSWAEDREPQRILNEGMRKGTIRHFPVDLRNDKELLVALNDKFSPSNTVINVMSDDEHDNTGLSASSSASTSSLFQKGARVLILYDDEWWAGSIVSVGATKYKVQFDADSTFCELPHEYVKLMPNKPVKFGYFNESQQAQITSSTTPSLPILSRVNQELRLREVVLKAVVFVTNNTVDVPATADLPENSLDAVELVDLKEKIVFKKFATVTKIRDYLTQTVISSEISNELYGGWKLSPFGGKRKFEKTGTKFTAGSGAQMEEVEVSIANSENRIWLGRFRDDGVWEISSPLVRSKAITYILNGLVESG